MSAVAELPGEIERALERFRPLFNNIRAFNHFKDYVFGLMISDNHTVAGIKRNFVAGGHPSCLNKFLIHAVWSSTRLNEERLNMLKEEEDFKGKGCLVLDDTLSNKTGKKIEGVGILWDHGKKRHTLCHNLVTSQFVKSNGCEHPLDFRLYLKKDYCLEEKIEFQTKIQQAMDLVDHALSLGINIEAVLFDCWFGSNAFFAYLKERFLPWVAALRANRNVKIKGEYISVSAFEKTLPRSSFRNITIGKETYLVFSKVVHLKGVGKVRLLISYEDDFEGTPFFLATDRLTWDPKRILKLYKRRWKIETFYRDSKQNLGLEDYQLRDLHGIKRHWYLVFLAYSLLASNLLGINAKRNDKDSPTIGEGILKLAKESFRGLVKWVIVQAGNGRSADDICQLAYPN